MNERYLVITSISSHNNPVLQQFASGSVLHNTRFIVVGDTKSPKDFHLDNCDFYSIEKQLSTGFEIASLLPEKHYSRKNIGYLVSMSKGCDCIIETDDDNIPFPAFWEGRSRKANAYVLKDNGWVNIYKYFSKENIWPRGFSIEKLKDPVPSTGVLSEISSPIQQGLADQNPDVDAIYRLVNPLPVNFLKRDPIATGKGTWCPFNSQNTTWFREAFLLMYLPSFCSFRMTDIWRSFIAQRIAWTCGWVVIFHNATVYQERNEHSLIGDFRDEIPGYLNNGQICHILENAPLKTGVENIPENLLVCYKLMVDNNFIEKRELDLVEKWILDCKRYIIS